MSSSSSSRLRAARGGRACSPRAWRSAARRLAQESAAARGRQAAAGGAGPDQGRASYREALAKVRDAEAVGARNANETYLIERMRLAAASGAGDAETAARSYEALRQLGPHPGRPTSCAWSSRSPAATTARSSTPRRCSGASATSAKAERARDPDDADPEPVSERRLRRRFQGADGRDPGRRARRHDACRGPAEAAAQRGGRSRATTTPTCSRWKSSSPTTRRRSTGSTC